VDSTSHLLGTGWFAPAESEIATNQGSPKTGVVEEKGNGKDKERSKSQCIVGWSAALRFFYVYPSA